MEEHVGNGSKRVEILRKNQKEVLEIKQKQNKQTHWYKIEYAVGWIIYVYFFEVNENDHILSRKGKTR